MFSGGQNGPREFMVSRASPRAAANMQPLDMGQTATVLEETCRCLNLAPNLADGGTHECRTSDDIPLRRRDITWGHSTNFVTTRLIREAVTSADMQPPASVFDWDY
jgi:hypothetical protein